MTLDKHSRCAKISDMDVTARRVISGLIAAQAGSLIFGFVIGGFTLFLGAIPGAILGYGLGFWWGFKRIEDDSAPSAVIDAKTNPDSNKAARLPIIAGDTAFLVGGFFGTLWLVTAVSNLFFGYTGSYRGHMLGWLLPLLGLMVSPFAAKRIERQGQRCFPSATRDIAGIAFLVLLVLIIAIWWRLAEARDQNQPYRPPAASQTQFRVLRTRFFMSSL